MAIPAGSKPPIFLLYQIELGMGRRNRDFLRGFTVQGIFGQLGGAVLCRFTSTTKSSVRKLRPKINGYLTMERSVRFTKVRIRLEPRQISNSTIGLRSSPSGFRICRHSMMGSRNCNPPYFWGNLNSTMSSCTLSSRASREDFRRPCINAGWKSHPPWEEDDILY